MNEKAYFTLNLSDEFLLYIYKYRFTVIYRVRVKVLTIYNQLRARIYQQQTVITER